MEIQWDFGKFRRLKMSPVKISKLVSGFYAQVVMWKKLMIQNLFLCAVYMWTSLNFVIFHVVQHDPHIYVPYTIWCIGHKTESYLAPSTDGLPWWWTYSTDNHVYVGCLFSSSITPIIRSSPPIRVCQGGTSVSYRLASRWHVIYVLTTRWFVVLRLLF